MWEHQGKCPCGRRSYLLGQCSKCLKEERELKDDEEAAKAHADIYKRICEDEAMFDLEDQRAEANVGSTHCCGPSKNLLPSVLPSPDVRTGTETRHVEFITDSAVKLISRDGPDGYHGKNKKGAVYVQEWAPHSEFDLKARAKAFVASSDYPYRIAFVIEISGDVVPLQQCTDVRFEDRHLGHIVKKSQWVRDPACLIGMWEPSPVSKQLDDWMQRRKGDEAVDEHLSLKGPIRHY